MNARAPIHAAEPSEIDRENVSLSIELPEGFPDPSATGAHTTTAALTGRSPIVYVFHDSQGWGFYPAGDRSVGATTTSLDKLLAIDPTLGTLTNLPFGRMAWRAEPGAPWKWQT